VTEVPLFSDLMYMYNTQTSFSKKYDSNNNKIFDFQLHPNPTNCKTNIYFNIKSNSNIELKVFNISGQLVDLLFNNICSAGQYYLTWEGIDLEGKKVSTGLYLIRLSINGTSIIKKLIIIK
jgi:flagellar hook assembly protein FlgD